MSDINVMVVSPLRVVPRSVEEQVYELIRDRIVRAEYEPGTKFVLSRLAAEIGVSTMPVRSALKRLDGDGLVSYRANQGATVRPLDLERFRDIQEIRILIEAHAARLGAARISDAGLEHMRECLRILQAGEGTFDDQLAWEWSGYMTCYQASGREHLIGLIRDKGRLAERYARQATGGSFEPAAVCAFEHFLTACEERDGDAAAEAVGDGLRRHLDRLMSTLKGPLE